jgi:FAD/FMN-containing dehydrogenase
MKYNPEGVETFDVNTWQYGKQFLPEDTLRISEYFAKGEKLLVLAQFSERSQTETDTIAHTCVQKLIHISPRTTYLADPALVKSLWAVRRASFKILRDAVYDNPMKKAVPCMEDVIVPISRYDVFIPRLLDILQKNNLEFGFHGHIGDGAIRIIPIIDFTNKEAAVAQIEKICLETFSLIKELKGNMSADHGDGIVRTPFLREFYGDMLYEQVIVQIKRLFDPHGIFNVDKKISVRVEDWINMLKW